ncbi:MAG: hypothetical protein JWN45_1845 [Acidobacteriaceae bacterium]|jgi:hypothetical protein|nr:hypothetical protein [Acidobacteriaceae bacterium]
MNHVVNIALPSGAEARITKDPQRHGSKPCPSQKALSADFKC